MREIFALLRWPPQSPDLSAIEHLCDEVERASRQLDPQPSSLVNWAELFIRIPTAPFSISCSQCQLVYHSALSTRPARQFDPHLRNPVSLPCQFQGTRWLEAAIKIKLAFRVRCGKNGNGWQHYCSWLENLVLSSMQLKYCMRLGSYSRLSGVPNCILFVGAKWIFLVVPRHFCYLN